jgi:hypothetical protein
LPRRSGSDASSVVCSRIATKASCSRARGRRRGHARRLWPRTARPALGQPRRGAVERRSWRWNGPLQLDPERAGPEDPQQPAQRRLVADAVRRAAAEADEAVGVGLEIVEARLRRAQDPPARVVAGVRVRAREQRQRFAQPVASRTRSVTWRPSDSVTSARGSRAGRAPWPPGRTPSSRRRCHGREGERGVPALECGRHELLGWSVPVPRNEKGRVGVSSDVGARTHVRIGRTTARRGDPRGTR